MSGTSKGGTSYIRLFSDYHGQLPGLRSLVYRLWTSNYHPSGNTRDTCPRG
jgi:hypothetical protein